MAPQLQPRSRVHPGTTWMAVLRHSVIPQERGVIRRLLVVNYGFSEHLHQQIRARGYKNIRL